MDAPRLDQETVERLLDGSRGGVHTAPPTLVRCLDAVRAGPRSGELDGEAAAVAQFRAARASLAGRQPAVVPVRRPAVGAGGGSDDRPARRVATLLGVKVALATLAATLTGGVALAAVTGNLPGAGRGEAPPSDRTTSTAAAPSTTGSAPTAHPTRPAGGPTAGAPDLSTPAGLCLAYRAVGEAERGRALAAPAFAGLVAAAGGADRVPGYCTGLLAGSGSPGPAGPPSGSGPTGHPAGPPTGTPAPSVPDPGTGGPPSDTATPTSGAARTPGEPTPGARRTPAGRGSGTARPPTDGVPTPGGPPTG
ncbi:hypothetical protein O7598_19695 [Micromonospora sp. WMMC241]|uniref:hypothetical protein n=1 Tax=Micromonospora sp. WMMC241 TaxID=3015159 RepID=UPI0022B60202|nr:hypothetical protein [Micromonospora sp. WMMC241]MCZ7438644.1 hypothetical protein [Micromonospora sp. WMMC241]